METNNRHYMVINYGWSAVLNRWQFKVYLETHMSAPARNTTFGTYLGSHNTYDEAMDSCKKWLSGTQYKNIVVRKTHEIHGESDEPEVIVNNLVKSITDKF